MILVDTFILEEMEVITEEKNGQACKKLRGVFQRADEANNNKRVYSKAILEREVTKLTEALKDRRLLGELDHPQHDSVKLSNVSHLITNLHIKDNDVIGECELLNTPAGKVAQALVEGGVKVGISSRGMGTLSDGADGTKNVNEDFKLVTFDLVADPSTRGAFPSLAESKQSVLVENIVKDTLDKAAKEKVFTTLLKQKLIEKTTKKGNKNDPLSIWRGDADFGHNNRQPRKAAKHRTYDNAEEPTETMKVLEAGGLFSRIRAALTPKKKTEKPAKMSQEDWDKTLKRSISSMKSGDPRGPQHSSTDYSLVRSVIDTKLNEDGKKKKKKPKRKELTQAQKDMKKRAEEYAQMSPEDRAKAPETREIIQGISRDVFDKTPRIKSTGQVPRRFGWRYDK